MCRPIDHTHTPADLVRRLKNSTGRLKTLEEAPQATTNKTNSPRQAKDHDKSVPMPLSHTRCRTTTRSIPQQSQHTGYAKTQRSQHTGYTQAKTHRSPHTGYTGEDPTKPTHRLHTGEDPTKPTHRLSNKHHSGSASQNDKLHQKNPTQGKPDEQQ